ncbi:major facilitator superfamily domain-containing protein [Cantharellus anzutake]|uniref:major facilitator superfamily domain-containing protein n=1 Tax=Cantharellus anzutake TaxID=1750568 RepID=UPI00190358BF|nr:major facilitator superfamily domain-containing protein [Cantharellus anzutake]KAF8313949.1 major facilitator superfamily domain-containing protein [Cantharellus anzutake]
MTFVHEVKRIIALYSPTELRNIATYILGIMLYKFGLELFNGSVVSMATDRFTAAHTFGKLAILTGLNTAMQCVGAILIAPLVKKLPTRTILASAILIFAIMSALLLIVDGATGGRIKSTTPNKQVKYGDWNPNGLFPIYIVAGIAYGMVELIRRVIPRDIVGPHPEKLRRMDALVHILYEVSGTAGAFACSMLIGKFGNNYSFMMTPIFYILAGIVWFQISALSFKSGNSQGADTSLLARVNRAERHPLITYCLGVIEGFRLFLLSILKGCQLVFCHRKYVWLFFSYSVALHCHRYLENIIAPIYARRILNNSGLAQVFVAFSNLGELHGALFVFLFARNVKTPIPWLRLDALLLMIIWVVPFYERGLRTTIVAYRLGACFIPISFGWAAGDVSLSAYIQLSLTHSDEEQDDSKISSLGSIMAFLYSSYIIIYAVVSKFLGDYVDRVVVRGGSVHDALILVGGIHFSAFAFVIFVSTFVPRGAFALNPEVIYMSERSGSSTNEVGQVSEIHARHDNGVSEDITPSRIHDRTRSRVPPTVLDGHPGTL